MPEICKNSYGVVNIKYDNTTIEFTEADIKVQPQRFFRRPKPNGKFVVERTSPKLQFTAQMPPDAKVQDLMLHCSGQLVAQEANGRVWVLEQASATWEDLPYSAKEGEVMITYIGTKMREMIVRRAIAA